MQNAPPSDPLLEIRAVGKRFPGVVALADVTFDVARGEVHALVGENGAGKSTLMKILSGVTTDYDGALVWDGTPLHLQGPRDAQARGIAIIHQELNLVPELSVAENIFLGREPRTSWGTLDARRMAQEARAQTDRLGLDIAPARPLGRLRVGERQLVEIAKALSLNARLLILDEPTSALSDAERERLFSVIEALKRDGVTMIYISHKLDETFRLADRVSVLRDGRYIGTRAVGDTDEAALIRMMVGRPLTDLFARDGGTSGGGGELDLEGGTGEEVLRVDDLGLRAEGRTLHDISFTLRRGEILGLAGLMGAGRTELLETLFGVHAPRLARGRVTIQGRAQALPASPAAALRAGLALVSEDRKDKSLVLGASVGHNITLAALGDFLQAGVIRSGQENAAVRQSLQDLHIKTHSPDVAVGALSGGNQQKVVLAKCLLTRPTVLLLDEPTRGIDVGAKAEIYALIRRLAGSGAGILLASSEMPELLALCDRILVLAGGRVAAEFAARDATQERILTAAAA